MNDAKESILDYADQDLDGKPFLKSGKPAEHDLGVIYQGPWEVAGDGFNAHVRRCARALAMTGCPVQLQAINPQAMGGEPEALPEDVADMVRASLRNYSTKILQVVPTLGTVYRLTQPALIGRAILTHAEQRHLNYFKVLSVVLERDRISPELADGLARVGQVWVACEANRKLLLRAGISDVRVIPVPYLPNDPLLEVRKAKTGPVDRAPRFYHIGKWEPRKAQDKIVHAFLRAFRPGDAHLVLKTRALLTPIDGYPQGPTWAIDQALTDPLVQAKGWSDKNAGKYVQVVTGMLSAEKMTAIHAMCDCYVTLSRGEGFDMPAFDAKLAGNLMVYTPSGGPQDFASEGDLRVEPNGSIERHSFYTDWEPESRYLDFSLEEAVFALRSAADRVRAGQRAQEDMHRFSAEFVGQQMLTHLQALHDSVGGGDVFRKGQA